MSALSTIFAIVLFVGFIALLLFAITPIRSAALLHPKE